MKIELDNNQSINYEILIDYKTKEKTNEWLGKVTIHKEEIELIFNTNTFSKGTNNPNLIDWEGVKFISNKIVLEVEKLLKKSRTILIAFHKEIFGNEYEEKGGFFDLTCIELTEFGRNQFVPDYIEYAIDLQFYLESTSDFLLDPYSSYHCKFKSTTPHLLTLKSVSRE